MHRRDLLKSLTAALVLPRPINAAATKPRFRPTMSPLCSLFMHSINLDMKRVPGGDCKAPDKAGLEASDAFHLKIAVNCLHSEAN